jgi:8-amino-7-oxononanoate synthase
MHMEARRMDLERHCAAKLDELAVRHQRRATVPTVRRAGMVVERAGRVMIDFSSNDSLGLSHHPEVIAAAQQAAAEYGVGAGASRLVSGEGVLARALEDDLARSKGAARSLLFSSGYAANLGVVPALVGIGDSIVIDAWAHACLMSAAKLSGAVIHVFRHNDIDHAKQLLSLPANKRLLITESVFSMDGDRAPLSSLRTVADDHDAWLLVDDAHGAWVGQPTTTMNDAHLITTTLSKALGGLGGAVCGPEALIELLWSRARTQVYSTGLPPPVIAAAHQAVRIAMREPDRCRLPWQLAARFCAAADLPPPASHIVPWFIGDDAAAMTAMTKLQDEGLLAVAIRAPTVPAGTARLRLSFSAVHQVSDVDRLAGLLRLTTPVVDATKR